MQTKLFILFLTVLSLALFSTKTLAAGVVRIQVLKISAQDQKAVVKTPEGTLKLVGLGDFIGGDARIIEIAEGRVVLEQPGEYGLEQIIVRLENGKQKIDMMRVEPLRQTPAEVQVEPKVQ